MKQKRDWEMIKILNTIKAEMPQPGSKAMEVGMTNIGEPDAIQRYLDKFVVDV